MGADAISNRQLNRTTLGRQLLLDRVAMAPRAAIEHLVGLQAQSPLDPYLALWSRLIDFDPVDLGQGLTDRELVRIVVMRGTIHLTTAADACFLRPLIQPVLERELKVHGELKHAIAALDEAGRGPELIAFAEPLLAETPMPMAKLRTAFVEGLGLDPTEAAAATYLCRNRIALVQIPPRGVWGKTLQVTLAPLETWSGVELRSDATVDEMALRYLAAFGPATNADLTAWSGLHGAKEVTERLRPQLRTYRDEAGRELFDLADLPLADPDLPAPVRFLPEFDNALLSHKDRSRFFPHALEPVADAPLIIGSVLHDGGVVAMWWFERDKPHTRTTVHVAPRTALPRRALAAIEAEGQRMVAFHEPGVVGDVHLHARG